MKTNPPPGSRRKSFSQLGELLSLGLLLGLCIGMGTGIGYVIDGWFGLHPWGVTLGILAGIGAAVLQALRVFRQVLASHDA